MKIISIQEVTNAEIRAFNSGNNELDMYFHIYAKKNDTSGLSRTFVYFEDNEIKGYITICTSEVSLDSVPNEDKNSLPKYPIPAAKIARLAVSKKYRNQGIEKELLKQGIEKIIIASSSLGVYFIVVDAKETSKSFYEKYGFKKVLDKELTYFVSIPTIIKTILFCKK